MRRSAALLALALVLAMSFVALALPAAHATPEQETPQRITVFETFGREICTICKAAAPTVDKLADDYAGRAIVVEHDIDNPTGSRYMKWWNAKGGGGSVQTPLVLVDSGTGWTNGSEDFNRVYRRLVDEALMRPPEVDIKAYHEMVEVAATSPDSPNAEAMRVYGTIQNISDITIGYDNNAQVNVMIYEDTEVIHSGRFVRAGKAVWIEDDVEEGETYEFEVIVENLPRLDMRKTHVAVIVDIRPSGGAWQALNAAFASDEVPVPPTQTPVPATDTPMPTFFIPPTDTPEPPTDEPAEFPVYMPDVRNKS